VLVDNPRDQLHEATGTVPEREQLAFRVANELFRAVVKKGLAARSISSIGQATLRV
jgi:hypothetical protein